MRIAFFSVLILLCKKVRRCISGPIKVPRAFMPLTRRLAIDCSELFSLFRAIGDSLNAVMIIGSSGVGSGLKI